MCKKLIAPLLIPLFLLGCVKNTRFQTDTFCLNYSPIFYPPNHTTKYVQDQIDPLNAKYDALCK